MKEGTLVKVALAIGLWAITGLIHADEADTRPAKIAIIIDDIGYNLRQGELVARFPAPLTLAVLPHAPNSRALAKLAHTHGKEIMLHAPMSTVKPQPMDRGALHEAMDQHTFISTLRDNIAAIPYITGLNNHMGSALTQNQQSMNWLMEELQQHGLFFIDSRTTASSVAFSTAQDFAIPSRSRDVFLDHERTTEAVGKQFQQLVRVAKKNGSAIAIGHPAPVTMSYLATQVTQLHSMGVQLVSVSELIPQAASDSEPEVTVVKSIAVNPTVAKPTATQEIDPIITTTRPATSKDNTLPAGYFPEDKVTIY